MPRELQKHNPFLLQKNPPSQAIEYILKYSFWDINQKKEKKKKRPMGVIC